MMDILNKIIQHKQKEVEERKRLYPIDFLEQSIYYSTPVVSLRQYIRRKDKSGVIAEIKRKSPSKGDINPFVSVERTSIGYMQAGASALSVLTDETFFGGSSKDLMTARKFNFCPILRKDFIIDEYQLIESKSIGADAVLLIAAVLDPTTLKTLCKKAHDLKMEVLLEVHDEQELNNNLDAQPDLIGINCRNLNSFEVDNTLSKKLVKKIPDEFIKIAESGIAAPATAVELKKNGFDGFLIGATFMKNSRPEIAAQEFIKQFRKLDSKSDA